MQRRAAKFRSVQRLSASAVEQRNQDTQIQNGPAVGSKRAATPDEDAESSHARKRRLAADEIEYLVLDEAWDLHQPDREPTLKNAFTEANSLGGGVNPRLGLKRDVERSDHAAVFEKMVGSEFWGALLKVFNAARNGGRGATVRPQRISPLTSRRTTCAQWLACTSAVPTYGARMPRSQRTRSGKTCVA